MGCAASSKRALPRLRSPQIVAICSGVSAARTRASGSISRESQSLSARRAATTAIVSTYAARSSSSSSNTSNSTTAHGDSAGSSMERDAIRKWRLWRRRLRTRRLHCWKLRPLRFRKKYSSRLEELSSRFYFVYLRLKLNEHQSAFSSNSR